MFTKAPLICATVDQRDRPVACSVFSYTEKNTMPKGMPQQMCR